MLGLKCMLSMEFSKKMGCRVAALSQLDTTRNGTYIPRLIFHPLNRILFLYYKKSPGIWQNLEDPVMPVPNWITKRFKPWIFFSSGFWEDFSSFSYCTFVLMQAVQILYPTPVQTDGWEWISISHSKVKRKNMFCLFVWQGKNPTILYISVGFLYLNAHKSF